MEITNVKNVQNSARKTSSRYKERCFSSFDKEKNLHEESNLRPSNSALRSFTTEPQRLHRNKDRCFSSCHERGTKKKF